MIELEFGRFCDQDYVDEGFGLYVLRNGLESVLYIGISTLSVWERWFGWNGHVIILGNNIVDGRSSVGQKIVDHLPDSLKWKIQLWTLEECIRFYKDDIPSPRHFRTLNSIESFMIRKLSPILNVSYNLNPGKDCTPKSKKEIEREKILDRFYKDMFDKK